MKKRKDGRYCRKVTLNDGTTKYFYSSASTERMAERDINRQLLEYKEAKEYEKHNFLSLATRMLEEKEGNTSYNGYQSYVCSLKHLEPFYDMPIEEITPSMLQLVVDDMAAKQYAYGTIAKVRVVFSMTVNYAIVQEDLRLVNFTAAIKIPRTVKHKKVTSPDDVVISAVSSNAETVEFGMRAMMELCTGLRRGELNALRKRDIDFEAKKIHVKYATEFINNRPHLKEQPKTENGIRDVPILSLVEQPLKNICHGLQPGDFIFGKTEPYSLTMVRRRWDKYCRGIGHNFKQHQLRHAYAKLLYCAGIDPKTMQHLLGHAKFETTMNIYTEFANEMTEQSVSKLNEYMSNRF